MDAGRRILPAEAWTPLRPFEEHGVQQRLMTYLNSRISKFHVESAAESDPARRAAEISGANGSERID